jgi:hypothetical protein
MYYNNLNLKMLREEELELYNEDDDNEQSACILHTNQSLSQLSGLPIKSGGKRSSSRGALSKLKQSKDYSFIQNRVPSPLNNNFLLSAE